jgi:hypothetical protein
MMTARLEVFTVTNRAYVFLSDYYRATLQLDVRPRLVQDASNNAGQLTTLRAKPPLNELSNDATTGTLAFRRI